MNLLTPTRPRRPDAKTDRLAALEPFRSSTQRELAILAPLVDETTFLPGRALIREDQHAIQSFFVASGRIGVTRRGLPEAETGAGAAVGVAALLGGLSYTHTVVALEEVRAFVLTSRALTSLLMDIPGIARPLLREIVRAGVS